MYPIGVSYHKFTGVMLPTGITDDIPYIVINGNNDGPCLWVTGSIHGNEYSGASTIHHLIGVNCENINYQDLNGTLILVPTLNPSGLRIGQREPYYNNHKHDDPNRLFPDFFNVGFGALESVYEKIFNHISETADALIDLHNATIGSVPFSLRDPIYCNDELHGKKLMQKTDDLLLAFGMAIVNEYPSESYLSQNLHRSVSGSVLNVSGIPAFTVELGGFVHVDTMIRDAAVIGVRNVMREMGILSDAFEDMPPIVHPKLPYPVRRTESCVAEYAGFVIYYVDAGDIVKPRQLLAHIVDIYGNKMQELISNHNGYVIGQLETVVYKGDNLFIMAIQDDSEMIIVLN